MLVLCLTTRLKDTELNFAVHGLVRYFAKFDLMKHVFF